MRELIFPRIISHRGAHSLFPENSLLSFQKSLELGCSWTETDLALTSDGQIIVFHDERTGRLTECDLSVPESSLADLMMLSLKNKTRDRIPIPVFSELLEFVLETDMNFNLELKLHPGQAEKEGEFAEIFLNGLPDEVSKFMISSFDIGILRRIRKFRPELRIALNYEEIPENPETDLDIRPVSIHIPWQKFTPGILKYYSDKKIKINCFTVNDPEEAEKLWQAGVTSVFCDVPEKFPKKYLTA